MWFSLAIRDVLNLSWLLKLCYTFFKADAISCAKENNDKVLEFLQELSEGEILRGIICDMVIDDSLKCYVSNEDVKKKENGFSSSNLNLLPTEDIPLSNGRFSCYLDILLELCLRHDFPEKLVTFLLQLLPNQEYKVMTLFYCLSCFINDW